MSINGLSTLEHVQASRTIAKYQHLIDYIFTIRDSTFKPEFVPDVSRSKVNTNAMEGILDNP